MKRTVREFMTTHPHSIGHDQHISKAQELLREYKIRHLPVLKGGRVIGIISDRDIKFALALMSADEKKNLTLEDICTDEPFAVGPDADLKEVASQMAEHRFGSAIVRDDNNHLLGIFTSVDACRALAKILG